MAILFSVNQISPLAEDGLSNGKLLSFDILGARQSSPSSFPFFNLFHDSFLFDNDFWRKIVLDVCNFVLFGILFFDLFHDTFLLGNNFWRQVLHEAIIGILGGCFRAFASTVATGGKSHVKIDSCVVLPLKLIVIDGCSLFSRFLILCANIRFNG